MQYLIYYHDGVIRIIEGQVSAYGRIEKAHLGSFGYWERIFYKNGLDHRVYTKLHSCPMKLGLKKIWCVNKKDIPECIDILRDKYGDKVKQIINEVEV